MTSWARRRGKWLWRRASARYPRLPALKRRATAAALVPTRLAGRVRWGRTGGEDFGLNPANFVWIYCVGRSGSTWLADMMGELAGHRVWFERRVSHLFGQFYAGTPEEKRQTTDFIMGDPNRGAWVPAIRHFVLSGARQAFPLLGPEDYLVVKEPGGGSGAPLILEALPESRMVLLVRDPRDVVASFLDASRKGSWSRRGANDPDAPEGTTPDAVVRSAARKCLRNLTKAKQAHDAHKGPKAVVRYEDLVADAPGAMRRLYSDLGIPAKDEDLARAVGRHAWSNIPAGMKGEGKFHRKGSPGGWREDLTEEQARTVEKITAPILEEFYGTPPGS